MNILLLLELPAGWQQIDEVRTGIIFWNLNLYILLNNKTKKNCVHQLQNVRFISKEVTKWIYALQLKTKSPCAATSIKQIWLQQMPKVFNYLPNRAMLYLHPRTGNYEQHITNVLSVSRWNGEACANDIEERVINSTLNFEFCYVTWCDVHQSHLNVVFCVMRRNVVVVVVILCCVCVCSCGGRWKCWMTRWRVPMLISRPTLNAGT